MNLSMLARIGVIGVIGVVAACSGGGEGDGKDSDTDTDTDTVIADADQDGAALPDDCNDEDDTIFPGADEVPYDGIDQDCADGDLTDVDGDGFDGGPAGDDCDDEDADASPSQPETYYDGVDNDCDPDTVDDDQDGDGDPDPGDCDDLDPTVSSATPEVYYDGIDNDCDAATVDDDQDHDGDPVATDCDDEDNQVAHTRPEVYYDGLDNDCDPTTVDDDQDSDGDPIGSDCEDRNPNISSLEAEIHNDGLDNDCDPSTPDILLDPIAVGFSFDGVVRADGTLEGYYLPGYAGYGEIPATMTLIYADLEFFYSGNTAYTCSATGYFTPPPLVQPAQIPTFDGSLLSSSYDTAFVELLNTCGGGVVDESVWGPDAIGLTQPFDGAHLGYGFGVMTDYLRQAWDAATLASLGDGMVASYIAINDASGAWVATDWTTGLLWEWDEATGELAVDAGGYLVPVDVSGVAAGELFPDAYVRSYPYWYQDFPLMDFSNLSDPPN